MLSTRNFLRSYLHGLLNNPRMCSLVAMEMMDTSGKRTETMACSHTGHALGCRTLGLSIAATVQYECELNNQIKFNQHC